MSSIGRRRTYLNYLFENMTYLTNFTGSVGLDTYTVKGEMAYYRSRHIISSEDYNLSSYNRLMLIFQMNSDLATSYENKIKIITIIKNSSKSVYINDFHYSFITIDGISNYGTITNLVFDDGLYFEYSIRGGSVTEDLFNVIIPDLTIIGINE